MIKFLDLQKINAQYQNQFHLKMQLVLDKGWFVLSDEVKQFETNFTMDTFNLNQLLQSHCSDYYDNSKMIIFPRE